MAAQPWTCPKDQTSQTGNFCAECGTKRPATTPPAPQGGQQVVVQTDPALTRAMQELAENVRQLAQQGREQSAAPQDEAQRPTGQTGAAKKEKSFWEDPIGWINRHGSTEKKGD